MDGIIGFFYLVLGIGCILIILMGCNAISIILLKHKYSNVITCLTKQGYRFCRKYNSKGKGLLYSKYISKDVIDSLLLRYNYPPIELECEYDIVDYVAILKFPEREERYTGVIYDNGGIRLFHFYIMEIKRGGKIIQSQLGNYLDNDMGGTPLDSISLENKDTIQSMLSSNIKYAIRKFNNDEVEYWSNKIELWNSKHNNKHYKT